MIIKKEETFELKRRGNLVISIVKNTYELKIVRLRFLLHRYSSHLTTIDSILLEYIIVKSRL